MSLSSIVKFLSTPDHAFVGMGTTVWNHNHQFRPVYTVTLRGVGAARRDENVKG